LVEEEEEEEACGGDEEACPTLEVEEAFPS